MDRTVSFHMQPSFCVRAACLLLSAWVLSCGGSQSGPYVAEFTAEDGKLFGNDLDLVANPSTLEGDWGTEWTVTATKRVRRANFVAEVDITTVAHDHKPGLEPSVRLAVTRRANLLGRLADEVVLRSTRGRPGYGMITANESRLLEEPFILFARRMREADSEEIVLRWHLSPGTPDVRRPFAGHGTTKATRRAQDSDRARQVVIALSKNTWYVCLVAVLEVVVSACGGGRPGHEAFRQMQLAEARADRATYQMQETCDRQHDDEAKAAVKTGCDLADDYRDADLQRRCSALKLSYQTAAATHSRRCRTHRTKSGPINHGRELHRR